MHKVAYTAKLFDFLVGNVDVKLILDRHDDVHKVEAVGAELIGHGGLHGDLGRLKLKLFADDASQLFKDHI